MKFNSRLFKAFCLFILAAMAWAMIPSSMVTASDSSTFILPPTQPPETIRINGVNNAAVLATTAVTNAGVDIVRPTDGSDKWYSDNLNKWKYDVEIQEMTLTGSGTMSASTWMSKPVFPTSVPANATGHGLFSLTNAQFFSDPESSWSIKKIASGNCREMRIRARVHADTTSRPWTPWLIFNVVAPKSSIPVAPGPHKVPLTVTPKK
jgi:hypothetical protein